MDVGQQMKAKRRAQIHARAERKIKALAWRLGLTPTLLKIALEGHRFDKAS